MHMKLRLSHRLRMFENRVLRRIFGPKREEVTGGCRKLQNKKLRNLYSPPYISLLLRSNCGDDMGGACNTSGRDEKFTQNFSRKTVREKTSWNTLV
jgi:hypothetical protein